MSKHNYFLSRGVCDFFMENFRLKSQKVYKPFYKYTQQAAKQLSKIQPNFTTFPVENDQKKKQQQQQQQ